MAVDYHTQAGLNAYKAYIALKQHFTKPEFDYFKYGGKTNASLDSYKKRKDAIFFEMIGKHPDPINFIAFNLATFDKVYPKDLATGTIYKQNYEKIKSQLDSITYQFSQIVDASYFAVVNKNHSHAIKDYLAGKLTLLMLCAADAALDIAKTYDENIIDPVIWPKISLKIKKLKPFLGIDGDKLRQVFISRWKSNLDT